MKANNKTAVRPGARAMIALFALFALLALFGHPLLAETMLLNVSYDPTRELYREVNRLFSDWHYQKYGERCSVKMSHGGSSRQAGHVMAGLRADVVSLATAGDIDAIANRGFIAKDWQSRKPNNSTPYFSVIVFLVRKGNPKGIRNWDDLARPGVQVITSNPKTSGGGKWNFLSAYGAFWRRTGSKKQTVRLLRALYANAPVMDAGSRGSATTFIQRKIGDVLIIWENEAKLALREAGNAKLEIVYPPISILAEPALAVVDRTVRLKNTQRAANDYLDFLYTPLAQEAIAASGYRPVLKSVLAKRRSSFPEIALFSLTELFPDWAAAQRELFDEGALFDSLFSE